MMATGMRSIRAIGRAFHLDPQARRQAIVAALMLGYANLALKLLPFSKAISIGSVKPIRAGEDREHAIADTVRAVRRASYAVPWRTLAVTEAEIDPAEMDERHRDDHGGGDQ
jgi:hypothetical protein